VRYATWDMFDVKQKCHVILCVSTGPSVYLLVSVFCNPEPILFQLLQSEPLPLQISVGAANFAAVCASSLLMHGLKAMTRGPISATHTKANHE